MASFSIYVKSILKSTRLGTTIRRYRWNKGITSESGIRKLVQLKMKDKDAANQEKVVQDILDMARRYRFTANEYFYYNFYEKSEEERKTFISDLNRIDFCEKLNKAKNLAIFDDKMRSAEVFGKYYGRDVCDVKGIKDFDHFKSFVEKHKKFILKPLSGTCGQGIKILEVLGEEEELKQLLRLYTSNNREGFIAEELIVQVEETAKFHPASVNTIRIATIMYDEGPEVWAAFFRTGRNNSVVDNAGAGGVFGTIDLDTGKIRAVADEEGCIYTNHPDTDIPMVGFTIPKWEEAKAMAKELAKIVKGNRYAGWDLALTEKGWIMVEGNARGQFVWQIPDQKGWMPEVDKALKRLHLPAIKKLGTK